MQCISTKRGYWIRKKFQQLWLSVEHFCAENFLTTITGENWQMDKVFSY